MFTVFLLSAGGGRSKNSPTDYNLTVLLAFGIQLTINRDSPSLHIVKHAHGGGGGGGGGGEVCPPARIVEAFDAPIIFMHEKTHTIQEN